MPRSSRRTKTSNRRRHHRRHRFGDDNKVDFESDSTSPFQNETETRKRRGSVLELPVDLPPMMLTDEEEEVKRTGGDNALPQTATTTTPPTARRIQRQPTTRSVGSTGRGSPQNARVTGIAAENYADYEVTGIHHLSRDEQVARKYNTFIDEDAEQAVKDRRERDRAELTRARESSLSFRIKSAFNKLLHRNNAFGKKTKKGARKNYYKKRAHYGFRGYSNMDY